jgi:hypothetical protein
MARQRGVHLHRKRNRAILCSAWLGITSNSKQNMKRTIWKYPLALTDTQNVMMPEGAEILTAQIQDRTGLCLWALVNSDAPKQRREIEVLGTGNHVPEAKRRYISTVQMVGGTLVWHIFERE